MTLLSLNKLLLTASFAFIANVQGADHITPTPWSSLVSQDIQRFMPSDEVRTLLAGEDEFIALYRQSMAGEQRGVALIIPDWQQLPTNNAGINFLRKELNDLGYATLAMTLPDIDWQAQENTESEESENTQSSSDEASNQQQNNGAMSEPHFVNAAPLIQNAVIDNYKLKLIARFNSLYDTALNEQGSIVVIAQGASAGLLIEHYANFPSTRLDALISLSSYLPNYQRNSHLNANISTISPPVLDLFFAIDNPKVTQSIQARQRWVTRNSKFDYRQRQLFGLASEPEQQQRLLKEVDGFLRRLF